MFLFISFLSKSTENVINQKQPIFTIMIDMNASPMKIMFHRIEREGIYDMNHLYKQMKEWFDENNYVYLEKENTTNIRDKGVELKMTMIGERRVTDYFQFYIEVKFLVIEMEKVKVKDKTLDKGKLSAFIKANLIFDYRNIWSKNKFSKLLRFIYNNFIIKKKIDDVYSAALKFESEDLFNVMKEALEMYNQ